MKVQSKVATGYVDLADKIALSVSCLLFTAKNPCVKTVNAIPLSSPSVTINNSATTGTATGSVSFSGVQSGSPYSSSGDPVLLDPI